MTEITRIAAVAAEADKTLRITWKNGRTDRVALAGWIATGGELLAALKEGTVFATARVGEYGADVEWEGDEELKIDAYHLALLATEQSTAFDAIEWQRTAGLSNQEAADFFDVALSTWNAYRAGSSPVPGAVRIAARAALRDPLLMQAHYRPRQVGRPPRAGFALDAAPKSRHGLAERDSDTGRWRGEAGETSPAPRSKGRGKQKKAR